MARIIRSEVKNYRQANLRIACAALTVLSRISSISFNVSSSVVSVNPTSCGSNSIRVEKVGTFEGDVGGLRDGRALPPPGNPMRI
jgi:hypothetical protein